MFDDRDDPTPPRPDASMIASAQARGRSIRHRRQVAFASGALATMLFVVLGGWALANAGESKPSQIDVADSQEKVRATSTTGATSTTVAPPPITGPPATTPAATAPAPVLACGDPEGQGSLGFSFFNQDGTATVTVAASVDGTYWTSLTAGPGQQADTPIQADGSPVGSFPFGQHTVTFQANGGGPIVTQSVTIVESCVFPGPLVTYEPGAGLHETGASWNPGQ